MRIASDGDEAVEAVRQADTDTYDLVLIDIQMPRMNGHEATRAIRKLGGVGASISIVAMTANALDARHGSIETQKAPPAITAGGASSCLTRMQDS